MRPRQQRPIDGAGTRRHLGVEMEPSRLSGGPRARYWSVALKSDVAEFAWNEKVRQPEAQPSADSREHGHQDERGAGERADIEEKPAGGRPDGAAQTGCGGLLAEFRSLGVPGLARNPIGQDR